MDALPDQQLAALDSGLCIPVQVVLLLFPINLAIPGSIILGTACHCLLISSSSSSSPTALPMDDVYSRECIHSVMCARVVDDMSYELREGGQVDVSNLGIGTDDGLFHVRNDSFGR